MRGAAGIGHRADGAEAVSAVVARVHVAVALEAGIEAAAVAGMMIGAEGVALPDFHTGVFDRPATRVENASDHFETWLLNLAMKSPLVRLPIDPGCLAT